MSNYNTSFRILKSVMSPVIKGKYKLQVQNSDIVPKDGPIIICTNHLHKRDQLSVFYSINRPIHYMAKKEYFDVQPTKTFYKLWGAIPTDRNNGSEAMATCQNLLEQGEAVGIFPEGTRNSLKPLEIEQLYYGSDQCSKMSLELFRRLIQDEIRPLVSQVNYLKELYYTGVIDKITYREYAFQPDEILFYLWKDQKISQSDYDQSLLLPFKYGAVKLAQKTGATIVTSAGDGKFDSGNVKFAYGDLFQIASNASDSELERYNNEIRVSIIKTYKKMR